MKLPGYVLQCLNALEDAGYPCYAVGGCVRDAVLGRTPHDFDLCTGATPAQIKGVFRDHKLVLAGEKHGTVGVITEEGVVEITTFRTEGAYLDNRHPDSVTFVRDIREDLARRDFTVNAMAWSPIRGFADPFGGREDLKNKILRAVGDPETRFREDSLRILRGMRFAVRFGLEPEAATMAAMENLAPLMENLARERVFDELCKLLPGVTARDLIRFAPILTAVIPELKEAVGFQQHNHHHKYDIFTHTALVTEGVPGDLALRWAALLHDVGKVSTYFMGEDGEGHFYGHAKVSAEMADSILRRLKAPNVLRERVVRLIELHMTQLVPEIRPVRRWISRLGWDTMEALLTLQEADVIGTGVPHDLSTYARIQELMAQIRGENACLSVKDLAVNGKDLMELGLTGPRVGKTLERLLAMVMDEKLPNEKTALLKAAQQQ